MSACMIGVWHMLCLCIYACVSLKHVSAISVLAVLSHSDNCFISVKASNPYLLTRFLQSLDFQMGKSKSENLPWIFM